MLSRFLKATGVFLITFGMLGLAFAGDSVQKYIKAHIEPQDGLNVSIHKVDANTGIWGEELQDIDFGTLTYDPDLGIFLPDHYCVMDVGVLSNEANWSVSHTVDSFTNGTDDLNKNVVVTFVKTEKADVNNDGIIEDDETKDTKLYQLSYANSVKSISKSELSGGWLRIYYGIATGEVDQNGNKIEPADTSPVTTDKSSGDYIGKITITLTP